MDIKVAGYQSYWISKLLDTKVAGYQGIVDEKQKLSELNDILPQGDK